ncbi:2-hexaprenyl-6-methoxy-1,4-benzoquinone methyltransferase [Globomyces sp. JEL0801]|nr:2-hexaprenyl-6-methoxy-1,4-benzoquinone methyltransferase [Globomyces sp. JEL0801]
MVLTRWRRVTSILNGRRLFSQEVKKTHFGFQEVNEDEKESLVRQVFKSVANNYDTMNDLMSVGVHRLWKDELISQISPSHNTKLLDVAGGTAIEFEEGNAENLNTVEDESIDVYTIAFGIRNCTHIDRVISEAYRVLKPGGRFTCLEFSHVENPLIRSVYDLHSFYAIPAIGGLVANDRDSYQYLVESIRKFPTQQNFANMIRDAGFRTVGDGYENLTFGVAAIHTGYKV